MKQASWSVDLSGTQVNNLVGATVTNQQFGHLSNKSAKVTDKWNLSWLSECVCK